MAPDLYQTTALLVAAYVLLFLPRALVNIRSGLSRRPRSSMRPRRPSASRRCACVPPGHPALTAPAAAGGAALVFLGIVNELTATLLLSPNGTRTLATEFWSKSSEIDYAAPHRTPLLMILISAADDLPPLPAVQESSGTVTEQNPSRLPEPRIAPSVAPSTNSHLEVECRDQELRLPGRPQGCQPLRRQGRDDGDRGPLRLGQDHLAEV